MKVLFDDFELDLGLVELRRRGRLVELQPKVFRLLTHLVENRSRAVGKRELLELLWPDETVVPGVLTTAMHALRRALGDDRRQPHFVKTVHGTGYRFVAPVTLVDSSEPPARASSEISESRHRGFIGREREIEAWRSTLLEPSSPTQVLFVHGTPGIGKTSFLHELAWDAQSRGLRVTRLSGDYLAPLPQALSEAIAQALGGNGSGAATNGELQLILIDSWERLAGLDEWLRETCLPELPNRVRIVLASRDAPSVRWRTDPAWRRVILPVELGPFSESESLRFLESRHIPLERGSSLFRYTRGHPLALALAADSLEPNAAPLPVGRPEMVEALVQRFVGALDDVTQRDVLVVASLVPVADESLLAATIGPARAHEMMDWLLGLSFARPAATGVSLHALAAEAIVAQMRARNVARLLELLDRTSGYLLNRIKESSGNQKLAIARQIHNLVRHHPMLRPLYTDEAAELHVELAGSGTSDTLPKRVEDKHGVECGRIVGRWLERQPDHVWVVRRQNEQPVAFVQLLLLTSDDRTAGSWDPVIARMFEHLDESELFAETDMIMMHRHFVSFDGEDVFSPAAQAMSEAMTCDHLWYPEKLPRLAHAYTVNPHRESWEPIARFGGFELLPRYTARVGTLDLGLFYHSFREQPVARWVADIMGRVTAQAH